MAMPVELKMLGRAVVKPLGGEGLLVGHRRAKKAASNAPFPEKAFLHLAVPAVSAAAEIVSPAVFNAVISPDKGFKKGVEVVGGLGIDGLLLYQITQHAPMAEFALQTASHVPGLEVLVAAGAVGAFLATKVLVNIGENLALDFAGGAIGRAHKFEGALK